MAKHLREMAVAILMKVLILYLVRHRIFLLISLAAISLFRLTKTLHTLIGMGSTALVAAVALPR